MSKRIGVFAVASLLICLLAGPAQGQMSAGVQAGVSLANLGGDIDEDNPSSKLGFSGGAFFGYQVHEYFRLQIQGQYVQKGAKFPDFDDEKTKVDYIEALVPLTVTIPIENSPIQPRVYAGPAVSFLLNCEFTNGFSEDCGDITKDIDFGIFFGGGADYMIGNGAIMLDVLYNLGLSNINDGADADEFSVKNNAFQFLAGYRFFFGS